jgi:uncharacterized membrane protein
MEQDKINDLQSKLDALMRRQEDLNKELGVLQKELYQLKSSSSESIKPISELNEIKNIEPTKETVLSLSEKKETIAFQKGVLPEYQPKSKASGQNMEQLIGGNLLNKAGIVILLLGIGVGVKYASDHNLIGPLLRIVLGYVVAIALGGIGYYLRPKHQAYSASLMSGSFASLYVVTYLAHSLYGFYSLPICFVLMLVFTILTVATALWYDREIIAVMGLVGAYAVPVLLSDGSGKVIIFFSYISFLNAGILFLSFRKTWKGLSYAAFGFTWIAYLAWFSGKYDVSWINPAFIFAGIFFLMFYLSHMMMLLLKDKVFNQFDGIVLLANALIYFSVGLSISNDHEFFKSNPIIFCLWCAILHACAGIIVYLRKRENTQMLWFTAAMSLACASIAIPLQYDGTVVTWLWLAEAACLIVIARSKNFSVLEILGIPLTLLGLISMASDWVHYYHQYATLEPLFNKGFASSIAGLMALGVIVYTKSPFTSMQAKNWTSLSTFLLVAVSYLMFALEINSYYQGLYYGKSVEIDGFLQYNSNYQTFKIFWLVSYTVLYCTIASACCLWWWKQKNISFGFIMVNIWIGLILLFTGLYSLSELRDSYLGINGEAFFDKPDRHVIWLRYIFYMLMVGFGAVTALLVRRENFEAFLLRASDLWLQLVLLAILSSELLNIMTLNGYEGNYRFGLSILWGVFGLTQVVTGFQFDKSHWRIGGLTLFGATLLKLFAYDIMVLGTGAKTIAFISLGVLLLAASFLYSRFKDKF